MNKLNAFRLGTIQDFRALVQGYVANGVTDIRAIQEHLDRHVQEHMKPIRVMKIKAGRKLKLPPPMEPKQCPSCGLTMNRFDRDGLTLNVCSNGKKGKNHIGCQYSELA